MWQARKSEPEIGHGLNHGDKIGKISGLDQIAICPQLVATAYVRVGVRSGEDHYRNFGQLWIRLDFRQNAASIFARQVEIQNNEVGGGLFRILSFMAQKTDGLLPVIHGIDVELALAVAENLAGEIDIRRVVVHQENFSPVFHSVDRGTPFPSPQAM